MNVTVASHDIAQNDFGEIVQRVHGSLLESFAIFTVGTGVFSGSHSDQTLAVKIVKDKGFSNGSVVQDNLGQNIRVGQKKVNGVLSKLGKRIVGGGKDGKDSSRIVEHFVKSSDAKHSTKGAKSIGQVFGASEFGWR